MVFNPAVTHLINQHIQTNMNKLITFLAISAFSAASAFAQAPGGAFVNEIGQLEFPDGTTIDPPAGEVVDGNLVIGEQTIEAPDATIDESGNLVLAGGTVLEVPFLPVTVFWFAHNLYNWGGDSWYSQVVGNFWTAPGNWTYWENWMLPDEGSKGWVYIHTVTGNADGFWAFHTYFDTWVYFYTGGEGDTRGFSYLESDTALQSGNFYVLDSGYYFYEEAAGVGGNPKTGFVFGPEGFFLQTR
jgi:hypothetical protein